MDDLRDLRDSLIIALIDALPLAVELNTEVASIWRAEDNYNSAHLSKSSIAEKNELTAAFEDVLIERNRVNGEQVNKILLVSSKIFTGIFMERLSERLSDNKTLDKPCLTSALEILKWYWLTFHYRVLERHCGFIEQSLNCFPKEFESSRPDEYPFSDSVRRRQSRQGRRVRWNEYKRFATLLKSSQAFYFSLLSTLINEYVPEELAKIIYDALKIPNPPRGVMMNPKKQGKTENYDGSLNEIPTLVNRLCCSGSPGFSVDHQRGIWFERNMTTGCDSICVILQFLLGILGDLARYKSKYIVKCTGPLFASDNNNNKGKHVVIRGRLREQRSSKAKGVKVPLNYAAKYYLLSHRLNPWDGQVLVKLGKLVDSHHDKFSAIYYTLKACLTVNPSNRSGVLAAYKNLEILIRRLRYAQSVSIDDTDMSDSSMPEKPSVIRYGQYEQNEVSAKLCDDLYSFLGCYIKLFDFSKQNKYQRPTYDGEFSVTMLDDVSLSDILDSKSAKRVPTAILVRIIVLTICGFEGQLCQLSQPMNIDQRSRVIELYMIPLRIISNMLTPCLSRNVKLPDHHFVYENNCESCVPSQIKPMLPSLRLFLAWWIHHLSQKDSSNVFSALSFHRDRYLLLCELLCECLVAFTQHVQILNFIGSMPAKRFSFRFDYTVSTLKTVDRTQHNRQINHLPNAAKNNKGYQALIYPMVEEFETLGLGMFSSKTTTTDTTDTTRGGQLSDIPEDFNNETPEWSDLPGYDKMSADRIQFILASCIKLARLAQRDYEINGDKGFMLSIRFKDGYFYLANIYR